MASLPRGGQPRHFGGGRYEVIDVLGSGGTATVYRVRDTKLDVDRALKVLRVGNADLGRRLAAEARMMARLDHPHILRVVDVGEEEGRPYLLMEHLAGGTLADVGEWGPLPLKSALGWTLQTLSALSAAHDLGIVHRDVKPSNVLLDSNGVARLADFGIAMHADGPDERETRTGVAMGTLAFMAPEQRLDARSVSRAADLYAVGASLYALVTYRSAMDMFVVQADDARLAGIPEPLAHVILKATRYQPEERYDSASEMARDLLDLFEQAEDEPLFGIPEDGMPAQRLRTATPGPLASRVRPPPEVTERAIITLIGEGTRTQRPTLIPETAAPVATRSPMWMKAAVGVVLLVGIVLAIVAVLPEREASPTTSEAALSEALPVEPAPEPEPVPEPVEEPETEPQPEPAPEPAAVTPRPAVTAVPTPAPVRPEPAAPTGPFPAGTYVGVLDGRPIDLAVSGAADALEATITAWFSEADRQQGTSNRQSRAFRGTWDEASGRLLLRDVGDFAGAGAIDAEWDGRRFSGRFQDAAGNHVSMFEARPR